MSQRIFEKPSISTVIRINAAKIPVATISVLVGTAIVTGLQFGFPQVLENLERTPSALREHQWWRLVTPLLVHSDGWRQIAFNFPVILIVGVIIERILGSYRWLVLYFASGLLGEIFGYAWQPFGAGASVGGAGLLGGLAAWLLLKPVVQARLGAIVILAGAIILTFLRDIHGPPLLAGAGLTLAMIAGNTPDADLGIGRAAIHSQRGLIDTAGRDLE